MNCSFQFSNVEIFNRPDAWWRIADAAHVCYNSKPVTPPDSPIPFLQRLEARGHMTPFEQAAIRIPERELLRKSYLLIGSVLTLDRYPRLGLRRVGDYIEGTVRAFLEAGFTLEFLTSCNDVQQVPTYVTMIINTDRGIANEFVRHRTAAYDDNGVLCEWRANEVLEPGLVQQSTRFVNFKDSITFYLPSTLPWAYDEEDNTYHEYCSTCCRAYLGYVTMINRGVKPQIARNLLPLAIGTVVVMSAPIRDWMQILSLRLAPDAHPEARYVAACIWQQLKAEFKQENEQFDKWAGDIMDIVNKAKEAKNA